MTSLSMSYRVLPASAGMILQIGKDQQLHVSAPRIRGDDPVCVAANAVGDRCSPHPRG